MSRRNPFISDSVSKYLLDAAGQEPPLLAELRAETSTMRGAGMQIGADQGAFMRLLLELMGARRAIEIGVYTGYSSICIATALGPAGRLVACDVNEDWTSVARRYWRKAGVADRVELRLRPALDTLDELIAVGAEPFDFVFIDADKENNDAYYERSLKLVRVGGLVMFDNALWGGSVAEHENQEVDTVAIRKVTNKVFADSRVQASLIAVGDGLLLARKR